MDGFIASLFLLIVASIIHIFAKKFKLPYTILLFIVGICLIPLTHISYFNFLNQFTLNPELLFYVFLPVLIFESGYNIKYQDLAKNSTTIWTLAIFGLIISTIFIGFGGHYLLGLIGFEIPIVIMLLFGVIISSTDPVAVLSIFKDFGVARRLSLLFEGESLFNDGTAVAIFLILIEMLHKGTFQHTDILFGIFNFIIMIFGGILLGLLFGILFSKIIKHIHNNDVVEIALTMILAHVTFISAEMISHSVFVGDFNIKISGVIATAYAAIVMGNYGKTKISPKVEEYMDKFWNFFAFVVNSLVFLLMGLIIKDLKLDINILFPILISIVLVFFARILAIYIPINILNFTKIIKQKIPNSRQILLSWGDLRGVLGLILALMIPEDLYLQGWNLDYSIKEFVLALVIGVIIFSLIFKGLTIKKLVIKLNLDKLKDLEIFEKIESEIIIYNEIISKIHRMRREYHTSKSNYDSLLQKYNLKLEESILKMNTIFGSSPKGLEFVHKAISIQALGIEKEYLKQMFTYNEIDEYLYLYFLAKIERQISRLERGEEQLRLMGGEYYRERSSEGLLEIIIKKYKSQKARHNPHDLYIIYRTKFIITNKVISKLTEIKKINFGYDANMFDQIIILYKKFNEKSKQEIETIKSNHFELVNSINEKLLNKGLMKKEEKLINDFLAKDMITKKLYNNFLEEIEKEVLKPV